MKFHRTPNVLLKFFKMLHGYHSDVVMGTMASQVTSLTIVCSTVYSGADQRKHQSSTSLAFMRGIHRWPVNSPHKGPVPRKMFPFDDVVMNCWDSWFFALGSSTKDHVYGYRFEQVSKVPLRNTPADKAGSIRGTIWKQGKEISKDIKS